LETLAGYSLDECRHNNLFRCYIEGIESYLGRSSADDGKGKGGR